MSLTALFPSLVHLLGLHLHLLFLMRLDILYSYMTNVRLDGGMRPVHTYDNDSVKPSFDDMKLVRTGDDHPCLRFLDLDQPFLGAHLEERGQGFESRVLNIHRGGDGHCKLERTIWQDIRLVEDRRSDWEGTGRQLRERYEN